MSEPKVVDFHGSEVVGFSTRTTNEQEMKPEGGKIGPLWLRFHSEIPVDSHNHQQVYGVYYDYESDANGEFNVLAGYSPQGDVSVDGLEKVSLPAGKYLVFEAEGEMPQVIMQCWARVWEYFSSDSSMHERSNLCDFEFYKDSSSVAIHIGVK